MATDKRFSLGIGSQLTSETITNLGSAKEVMKHYSNE